MQYTPVTQVMKRYSPFLREHPGLGDNNLDMGLMRQISVAILSVVIYNYGTQTLACLNQVVCCLWLEK